MNTKRILWAFVVWITMSVFAQVSAADISAVTQKQWIQITVNPLYETEYPTWANPDPDYLNQDLGYRVHNVLPFEQDRNKSAYLVYPKQWIIIPVSTLKQSDRDQIAAGNGFDHFPYLQESALHYVWASPSDRASNMVLAAHSSFEKTDAWKYKTAFQSVIYANVWDKVWYFEKNGESFDRYEYVIWESKEVQTTDTSIIKEVAWKTVLTTYTCYPIGTSDSRWFNRAELLWVTKWFTATKPVPVQPVEVKKVEIEPVIQEQDKVVEEKVHQVAEIKDIIAPSIQKTVSVYGENVADGKKVETLWVTIVTESPQQTTVIPEQIQNAVAQVIQQQDQPEVLPIADVQSQEKVAYQSLAENATCQVSSCQAVENPSYNPIYGIFTTEIKKIISPFFE